MRDHRFRPVCSYPARRGGSSISATCGATCRRALPGGARILHIGDNPISDVDMAVRESRHAARLRSKARMKCISHSRPCDAWCEAAKTVDDNRLLGQPSPRRLLNNPFATGSRPGPLNIDDPFTLGYCVFRADGPQLSCCGWSGRRTNAASARLLFFARDGYVLNRLYRKLRDRCRLACPEPGVFSDLPAGGQRRGRLTT